MKDARLALVLDFDSSAVFNEFEPLHVLVPLLNPDRSLIDAFNFFGYLIYFIFALRVIK